MRNRLPGSLALLLLLAPLAGRAEFLEFASGDVTALSGDGRVAFGLADDRPFAWRPPRPPEEIDVPGAPAAASFDGAVLAGRGYRWSALGQLDLGASRYARDVSADGRVVVGEDRQPLPARAFVWDDGVPTRLPTPDDRWDLTCAAEGVSGDGRVVAGTCHGSAPFLGQAVRWVDGVPEALGPVLEVRGISADGTTIVGALASESDPLGEAFAWRDGVFTPLGVSPRGGGSVAVAPSADGGVIVGQSPRFPLDDEDAAVLWDATHGMRSLADELAARGVANGAALQGVAGISDDGSTIAGDGGSLGSSWIAHVGPDADDDFVLDHDDAFPADPAEWSDRDGDGAGDSADAFPDDPGEQSDRDLDGVGDAGDPLPDDPTQPRRAKPVPGSVVVPAGASGLFQVDPASGALSWLAFAPGFSPDKVVVGPSGSIYTHDRENRTLHRVLSSTGEIRVVATGVGGALGLDADERPVLGGPSGVVRVDPVTGRAALLGIEALAHFATSPFGDAFGVRLEDAAVVSLDLLEGSRAPSKPARARVDPRSVSTIVITFPLEYPLDLAAAGPRRLAVLWALGSNQLSVGDPFLRTWVGRAASPPAPHQYFDPHSVALAGSGEIYVAGDLGDETANRAALLAFDGSGAPGRVVFADENQTLGGAWQIALVPELPDDPAALACRGALSAQLPKHLKLRERAAARCLAAHARGEGSAEACLEGWPVASKALVRTRAAEGRACEPGAAAAAAIGTTARDAVDGLIAELFGDLDAALVPRTTQPTAAACQRAVASASARCLDAQLAALGRCKQTQPGPFGASELEACSGGLAGDAAVRRACDPAAGRLARAAASAACRDDDPAALFPGCAAPNAGALAACAAERAACLACRAMESLHGLDGACTACP